MSHQFADKEMISDALNSQKHITGTYNNAANEMSCDSLKGQCMQILKEEHDIQMDVFKEMEKRGWYPTAQAQQEKINEAKTKFENVKNSL